MEPDLSYIQAKKLIAGKVGLCIGGGGVLGVGEIGSLNRWVEQGGELANLTHIVGASVGSMLAITIAAGADMSYIQKKLGHINFSQFKDGPNVFVKLTRFVRQYGWYDGESITNFLGQILQELVGNSDITMLELYKLTGKHLTIVYCSLNFEDVFYIDHYTEPNTKVKEAGRMSSGYPGFYKAYMRRYLHIDEQDSTQNQYKNDVIIDGGTVDNYPLHVLREQGLSDDQIFGLKLCSTDDIKEYTQEHGMYSNDAKYDFGEPTGVEDYLTRLIALFRNAASKQHVRSSDWILTVKINVKNMSSLSFNMTNQQALDIYNAGVSALDKFIDDTAAQIKGGYIPLTPLSI